MTLTECRNLTRLYSRLTTTSIDTDNVDLFIAHNEVGLAIDLIEMNPSLAAQYEDVTWPSGYNKKQLTSAFLTTAMGASDSVYKVLMVASRSGTGMSAAKYLYSAATMPELSGDGILEQRSETFATSTRWHFDGDYLWMYPCPMSSEELTIAVVLTPIAQDTSGDDMLEQFNEAGKVFSEGIAIRAAYDLRASLGYDLEWIAAKKVEFEQRLAKYARSLQLQEADHIGNVRWNHYA
jgi:hypothetical protein